MTSAWAQASPCAEALAEAEAEYQEQSYEAVEPAVLRCVYAPGAAAHEQVAAYRLLALAFVKQDRLADARATVVKLLGVDYTYDADLTTDVPLYVGLVSATKRQLDVDADASSRPASPVVPPAAPPGGALRPLVDVNTATQEELDTVPGIGPVIADRIVAYRMQNGPFQSVAELEAVRGIGPKTIQRMAPYLQVAGGQVVRELTRRMVSGGGVATAPSPAPLASPTLLINVNTASAEEMTALNGIGPALAARIVTYRTQNGPFRSLDDLVQVRGIGPKTLAGFAPQATVE